MIKGYKVVNVNGNHGIKYEAGKLYRSNVTPIVGRRGYHFVTDPADAFTYNRHFNPKETEVYEVEARGEIACATNSSVCATNELLVLDPVPWDVLLAEALKPDDEAKEADEAEDDDGIRMTLDIEFSDEDDDDDEHDEDDEDDEEPAEAPSQFEAFRDGFRSFWNGLSDKDKYLFYNNAMDAEDKKLMAKLLAEDPFE